MAFRLLGSAARRAAASASPATAVTARVTASARALHVAPVAAVVAMRRAVPAFAVKPRSSVSLPAGRPVRLLSQSAGSDGQPELTFETAKAIGAHLLAVLDNDAMSYAKALADVQRARHLSLGERWQAMTQVFLMSTVHAIAPYGFSADGAGLRAFTMGYETLAHTDKYKAELQQLSYARWQVLVRRAFGVKLGPKDGATLEQARQISSLQSLRMQSDAFLNKIGDRVAKLGSNPTATDRQKIVMEELQALQMETMEHLGFSGTEGYVRMQLALVQHSSDSSVAYNTAAAMMAVLKKAGIDPQAL